jgi:heptosyltransferase-3
MGKNGCYSLAMKSSPRKLLVIITRQIGDVLLSTPLLRALRNAYPDAWIDMLVYEGTEGVLAGNADFNGLISIPEYPSVRDTLVSVKDIVRDYDLAISTLSGDRPIVYATVAGKKRIGIVPPYRLQNAWKRLVLDRWTVLDDRDTHTVIQNLRLCDILGIERCWKIIPPSSSEAAARLSMLLSFPWREKAFAVLHLVPLRRYKYWTLKGWQHVSRYLKTSGIQVVITGSAGKAEIKYVSEAMRCMPEETINLTGKLTLAEVAELIRSSRIYIGTDTAVTHLAASTGVPTIALYGPTNPSKWAPWPFGYEKDRNPFQRKGTQRVGNVFLIQGGGDCVPCHQEGCNRNRESTSRCLEELESTLVIKTIDRMLGSKRV